MPKLAEACEQLMEAVREEMPWLTMAAILVIARLCEPSSELHIAVVGGAWPETGAGTDALTRSSTFAVLGPQNPP